MVIDLRGWQMSRKRLRSFDYRTTLDLRCDGLHHDVSTWKAATTGVWQARQRPADGTGRVSLQQELRDSPIYAEVSYSPGDIFRGPIELAAKILIRELST